MTSVQPADPRAERDARLAAWLQQAAAGDASAFERFYDVSIAFAQALARRMLRDADLDDVLADAYFQAWREAARFDAARGGPMTWLLTIVRSRALDRLRQRRASLEDPTDDPPDAASDAAGPPELLAGIEQGSRLHAALGELSAQERWLLALAYYRELTHVQISGETGLPLGTVKSALLRATAKLRRMLAAQAS